VHEILGFKILISEKHFCHREISEIFSYVRGLDPWGGDEGGGADAVVLPHVMQRCALQQCCSAARRSAVPF